MEKIKLSIDGIKIRMERRVEIISADRIIEITPSEKQGKFFEKKKTLSGICENKKKRCKMDAIRDPEGEERVWS